MKVNDRTARRSSILNSLDTFLDSTRTTTTTTAPISIMVDDNNVVVRKNQNNAVDVETCTTESETSWESMVSIRPIIPSLGAADTDDDGNSTIPRSQRPSALSQPNCGQQQQHSPQQQRYQRRGSVTKFSLDSAISNIVLESPDDTMTMMTIVPVRNDRNRNPSLPSSSLSTNPPRPTSVSSNPEQQQCTTTKKKKRILNLRKQKPLQDNDDNKDECIDIGNGHRSSNNTTAAVVVTSPAMRDQVPPVKKDNQQRQYADCRKTVMAGDDT
jgi:hypothetical protein